MKRNIVALFGACVVLMTSCDLDYTNNGTINPDNVWSDKNMISSFLTDIYGNMLPGWPVSANNTDEGMNGPTNMLSLIHIFSVMTVLLLRLSGR